MKELIQTIFSTSKERISNPIIGTFLISWTAFNWKPIIFLFLSDQKIENKINYIETNLTTINNLLLYPLLAVVVYVLIIPYFNLLFEYLLEFSRVKRNFIAISKQKQIIENKKELAIEEIKLEEAQTEFKERKNQNKLIVDLQTSIQAKEEQLQIERERFNDLNKKIKEESSYLNKRFQEDQKEFEIKMESLMEENNTLRKNLYELERNNKIDRILFDDENIIQNEDGFYRINKNGERIRIDNLSDIEKMRLRDKGIIK